ncbi:MAG: hypothetical protein IJ640_01425, partial [Prevotella sp.]|nr:hypothetical protein [Prevotella sp.]
MENKQQKIDDLFKVIDERIEFSQHELAVHVCEVVNAHDNIRFSRFVKAKVQEILGLPQDESVETLNIRNECGRRAKSGDVVMFGQGHFVVVTREHRKNWQANGYTPVGIYVVATNGETGMLSLVNMSCETPETGDVKGDSRGRFLYYGGYGTHVDGLKRYNDEDTYQKVIDRRFREAGHSRYGFLPSDKFAGGHGARA